MLEVLANLDPFPESVPINYPGPDVDIVFHLGAVSSTTGSATHCLQQNLEYSQKMFRSYVAICAIASVDILFATFFIMKDARIDRQVYQLILVVELGILAKLSDYCEEDGHEEREEREEKR